MLISGAMILAMLISGAFIFSRTERTAVDLL
jgi:hypothetical protein